jgi:hypothetical protein
MLRTIKITILATAAAAALSAGQIQLSGSGPVNNNVAGFGLTGVTSSVNPGQYIQPTGSNNCAGLQYNGSPCVNALTTGSFKGNYVQALFANATGISGVPDSATNTPNATGKLSSSLIASDGSGIQFDLMNGPNGSGGYSGGLVCSNCVDAQYWRSSNSNTDLIIPVGLANVASVSTLLNDYWGAVGTTNIQFYFCFSATSNGSCTPGQLVNVSLLDGTQVRSSIVCNSGVAGSCPTGTGATSISKNSLSATSISGGVTINTAEVFRAAYTGIPTTVPGSSTLPATLVANPSPWAGSTSGDVVLDAQQFLFGASNQFLSYIEVKDPNAVAYSSSSVLGSRFALSAITIDQAPEPSTIVLVLSGLGIVGLGRLRRRKN